MKWSSFVILICHWNQKWRTLTGRHDERILYERRDLNGETLFREFQTSVYNVYVYVWYVRFTYISLLAYQNVLRVWAFVYLGTFQLIHGRKRQQSSLSFCTTFKVALPADLHAM